jgi:hypothetical protein
MRGIAERDTRAMDRIVAQAWWNENFNGAGAKLKPLKYYLDQLKPKPPQTAEEIRAVFLEYQARGAPITIRHVQPDNSNNAEEE